MSTLTVAARIFHSSPSLVTLPIPQAPRPRLSAQTTSGQRFDEEEADGSDNEQGDYITEEEDMQYATITLGEEVGWMA
ncbi:hypothetical protein BGX38DRAFT_1227388 [Terfezia claveryi]|nr:hypothetical protein BGX38DRAFT_1227388 [Terfezia claveryi]